MTLPPDTILLWSAVAAVGLTFFGFAWLFVDAVDEGAGNYATAMGTETSRAFEDVFMFISPAKIARLGRLCPARSGSFGRHPPAHFGRLGRPSRLILAALAAYPQPILATSAFHPRPVLAIPAAMPGKKTALHAL